MRNIHDRKLPLDPYGIVGIGSYVPKQVLETHSLAAALKLSDETLERRIGFTALRRKLTSEDSSDMAFHAVQDLLSRHPIDPHKISCLVVVTQNSDGSGIPQTSALLHGKLGWPQSVASFDLSLGCSGYVYGLATITSLLAAQSSQAAVLVTADPYSKIVSPDDRGTALLFGDAATATLIKRDAPWRLGQFDLGTAGDAAHFLRTDKTRTLRMDGRGVSRFCLREVPGSVERVLQSSGISIEEVDAVILHQASRYMVETLAERIGAKDKCPFTAGEIGNTVSSSIPLVLQSAIGGCSAGKTLLLCAFGTGMSWASMVLHGESH